MNELNKYTDINRQKHLESYNICKTMLKKRGVNLESVDKRISKDNAHFFKKNIINIPFGKFNLTVHWLPEHDDKGYFEAWLVHKQRYIKITRKGFYDPEYYPDVGFADTLIEDIVIWFKEYIDPKNYKKFLQDSYPLFIEHSGKVYSLDNDELICSKDGKEVFRKRAAKNRIIGIEKSPANNGVVVLSKVSFLNNKDVDDLEGKRTSSLRLLDWSGSLIWFAERNFISKYKKNLEYYLSMKIKDDYILANSWESIVRLDPYNGNKIEGHSKK